MSIFPIKESVCFEQFFVQYQYELFSFGGIFCLVTINRSAPTHPYSTNDFLVRRMINRMGEIIGHTTVLVLQRYSEINDDDQ